MKLMIEKSNSTKFKERKINFKDDITQLKDNFDQMQTILKNQIEDLNHLYSQHQNEVKMEQKD
jgi:hypothetical protein